MSTILNPDGTPSGAPGPGAPAGATPTDLIKDSDMKGFAADVIEASAETPVLVDFWAPWCGPCKQLGPLMEKLAREYAGAVKLVKINVDENQGLAQQLRVQSIPMVYAFHGGRPVDAFTGALPESQLRQFIEKLTGGAGSPVEHAVEQAEQLLAAGDAQQAGAIFNQLLSSDPENAAANAGLAKCLMATGQQDRAREFIDGLPESLKHSPEINSVRAALDLSEKSGAGSDVEPLRQALAQNENDHQARYDLALALYGQGAAEEAVDQLVEIIKRNRTWNDDAARQQLLEIFEALGFSNPVAVEGRRKLSSVLFS